LTTTPDQHGVDYRFVRQWVNVEARLDLHIGGRTIEVRVIMLTLEFETHSSVTDGSTTVDDGSTMVDDGVVVAWTLALFASTGKYC
jgi:hypothetical protein